jgi:hypothetical protein
VSRKVALPRIGKFTGKLDAESLAKELALFEQALITKLQGDDQQEFGPIVPTATITDAIYNARPWEIARIDPTGGSKAVILPDPLLPTSRGAWIGVKNASNSTNVIVVSALNSTVDGASSVTLNIAWQFVWLYATTHGWETSTKL